MTLRQRAAPFGSMAAVDPGRLLKLPAAMQGEGVRLMLERGASHFQIARHLGVPDRIVVDMADCRAAFQRGGEIIRKEEE